MSLAPYRHEVTNLADALRWALADTRHAFEEEREEMTCHLFVQSDRGRRLGHGEVVTVRATGGMDHPAPILEAARAVASGVNAVAAIWVVPELCLTRLGSSRDGGGIGQLHADQLAGPDRCVHGVSFR